MALAKSQVQVSIISQLGGNFGAAFQQADKRLQGLSKSVADASKAVANVDAFRKQADAVKQAGYTWQAAKAKADQLRDAIAAQGAPTRKQTTELNQLERAAERAGTKLAQQREKLAEMGRELAKAGVNTGKLTAEQQRLVAELDKAKAAHDRAEASLARQQRIVSAMGSTWKAISGAAAGVTAAGAVLAGPTKKAMTYDERLSYMADTAAAGQGPQAYKQAKTEISNAVDAALKAGGGKRDDVAAALNTMVASGKFDYQEALTKLTDVARTAFASGASSDDVAKTAIALKSFGINDLGKGFDQIMRAGQLGGFELKDMAKSLPNQLALARGSGYAGLGGLADILALNQVAMRTAGNPDEAGNNVVNLLQKLTGTDFTKNMNKEVTPMKGDPTAPGKKGAVAFDWTAYMIRQREQGVSAVEAFAQIADRQVANDARYKELQKRLAKAGTDDEKRTTLSAMSEIAVGSNVGQLIHDRQALMAGLAALYGREEMKGLREGIGSKSDGAVAQSSANVMGETWAQAIRTGNTLARANEQAYNELSGPLGSVLQAANGLADRFPVLTTGAYAAGTALSALAAGIAGSAIWGLITKGGAGAAAGAAGAGAAGAAGAAGGAGAAASAAGLFGTAMKAAGPLAGAVALANSTTKEEDAILAKSAEKERAKMAELRAKYGQETLEKAYKEKAPWYQFGGVNNARPDRVEGWVNEYMADRKKALPGAPTQGPGLSEKVLESSTAASSAAKAASDAATAAQNRPNVTQNNSYSVTIQAAPEAGALEFSQQFERAMRERDRKAAADLRGSFMAQPKF